MIYILIAATAIAAVSLVLVAVKYLPIIVNVFLGVRVVSPNHFEKPEGDPVDFKSLDGILLRGYFIEAASGGGKTVIFAHEVGSSSGSWERYCRFLPKEGYNVFTFDFRGHGESENIPGYKPTQWPSTYEIEDLLGAFMYVRSRPEVGDIALFGISRGAATCLSLADFDSSIKAIVSDSAYSTEVVLGTYIRKWRSMAVSQAFINNRIPSFIYWYWRLLTLWVAEHRLRCRLISAEKSLKGGNNPPVFIIHGENDSYIGPDNARRLYDLAREPKEFWVVPGAKHNGGVIARPKEYRRRVLDFLAKHLSEQEAVAGADESNGQ